MPVLDFDLRVVLCREGAKAPVRGSAGAGALDLYAAENVTLAPGERRVVMTGVKVEIPPGFAGWVKSRSGLCRKGWTVDGGLVDSDYRGEIGVQCWNVNKGEWWFDHETKAGGGNGPPDRHWTIAKGERIAQLVLLPVAMATVVVVDELSDTTRGEGGFGSSGMGEVRP